MNDLFEKKISSKDRIKQFLMEKKRATNAEIASLMTGRPGQLSWGQRVREIRKELQLQGYDLKCRELKKGIYQYEVIIPKEVVNG